MNLDYSAQDLVFREQVRAGLAQDYDAELRSLMAQSKNGYLDKEGQRRWQKKLHARGWAAPDWAPEYGGPEWTPTQRYIFQVEYGEAGCPPVVPMGLKMVAHVIMRYGSAEQKARHLPGILASDVFWCQGYSEPGSGSDLSSLQMRAVRDGDHYVLNGSKIWTTHAQWADWMFCLVRTAREARQQDGISFLLLDMRTPGISVAALPTLDAPINGEQEVNQVFFDDVRVPVSQRIGDEGRGWTYAKYLLEFERGSAWAPGLRRQLAKLRDIALDQRLGERSLFDDPAFRRRYAELEIRVRAADANELRIFSGLSAGESAGASANMLKVVSTELQQDISELAYEAAGPYAQVLVRDTWAALRGRPLPAQPGPAYAAAVAPLYFNYRKTSIYGGANEIQRNIMARQLFGAPAV